MQADFPAQQLGQFLGNRQSQTGSFVLARQSVALPRDRCPLPKLLEDALLIFQRDADSGVFDDQGETARLAQFASNLNSPAFGGELDRVRQQVAQDLLELAEILQQHRQFGVHHPVEVDVFLVGQRRHRADRAFDQIRQRQLDGMQLHFAAFDLGQIEHVVDEIQQRASGRLNVPHITTLLFVQSLCVRQQHIAEAEDRIERRAQLVAHRREELVLEIVHLVQSQVDLSQFIDLRLKTAVQFLQVFLHSRQITKHPIEGVAEFLELVPGADVGPLIEIAACDGVADLLQVQDRFDDHVADDRVRGEHRQKGGDDRGRQQDRIVPRLRAGSLFQRK